MVLEGESFWIIGEERKTITVRAGEAVLIAPGVLHYEESDAERATRYLWLGMEVAGEPPPWCHRVLALGSDRAEVEHLAVRVVEEHHREEAWTQRRVALALQTLLLLLSRQAERSPGPEPGRGGRLGLNLRQTRCVTSAAHYFRENLRDPLSIAQVAAYHGLSPAHFTLLFRRYYGVAPREYVQRARLERVGVLLRSGELGLKEVARESGFVDAAHLCKCFRKRFGMSPGRYLREGGGIFTTDNA